MLKKLDEISKVAAIKASSSLSKMIEIPVGVDVSPAITITKEQFPLIMNPNESVVSMNIPVVGDLNGMGLIIFPRAVALTLCDFMLHKNLGDTKLFLELESSALIELANIVIGNFLSPFAHPLQLNSVMHRTPIFKSDKYLTIIEDVNQALKNSISETALIEIVINLNHMQIRGYMIIMLGMDKIQHAIDNIAQEKNE